MNKGVRSSMCGVVMLLAVTGCSTIQYVRLPDQSKRIENAEQSRIYLVSAWNDPYRVWIEDNGRRVGAAGKMGYLCWEREPGRTTITPFQFGAGGPVHLYARKGEVYYLVVTRGIWAFTLSESAGQACLKGRKPPTIVSPK